jgi:cyclic-di-GMP-binding protein
MANFSFDIVSEVSLMEVENAIHMAQKELSQRYDFKGSKSSIDFDKAAKKIVLIGDDDYKLRAVRDIVETKLVKRGISLKSLNSKEPEQAFEGTLRQNIELTSGFPKEKAKELVKLIKDFTGKVQVQIEGEKVRVISSKKDELQNVIAHLRSKDFSLPLQFTNYR